MAIILTLTAIFRWHCHVNRYIARQADDLRRTFDLLNATPTLSRVGGRADDVAQGNLTWTEGAHATHETSPAGYTPGVEGAMAYSTPDSLSRLKNAWEKGNHTRAPFYLELELIPAKGR